MLSLTGVALGAVGSLVGQYLVSRASTRQLAVQQAAAHRAELKDVILKFLAVAFRVEKEAARPPNGERAVGGVLDQLVSELWLAQAEIDLAARTEPLRGATYRYAARLAEAAHGGVAGASELGRAQVEFMDAAYEDLWPGQRRGV
ncbi:hypothetical protein ACGF12_28210 [Kitasatospora sp. NPDC048296]|uniref:hypothetical protein n=1 Tax=Kitasatospora sp. NPDC048296 TaxID=3364048 RepID=UPI0037114CC6